jgi:origin recognition complex subunit 3
MLPLIIDFRIVIAFQDTEAFPPSVISDFILRNQTRLSRLPILLLFGVASTIEQFQLMLPTSVIKALDSKIFEVRQNNECLQIIIDKV